MEPRVQTIVDDLLDALDPPADLVAGLCLGAQLAKLELRIALARC